MQKSLKDHYSSAATSNSIDCYELTDCFSFLLRKSNERLNLELLDRASRMPRTDSLS